MSVEALIKEINIGNNKFINSDHNKLLKQLSTDGQKPFAIVVACADSRVSPEIILNKKLGELFVIRVAGNVLSSHDVASIEYAALCLDVSLCIIIGHSKCGAVGEAVRCFKKNDMSLTPSLQNLVDAINPAVEHVASNENPKDDDVFLDQSILKNAELVAIELSKNSDALAKKIAAGEFNIKHAVFDMDSGKLNFHNNAKGTCS